MRETMLERLERTLRLLLSQYELELKREAGLARAEMCRALEGRIAEVKARQLFLG